ncbi:MAG TPA: YdeI/OmpD-associated family protein [Gemmatimonadales bacterium]|jgi:hypothetical protein
MGLRDPRVDAYIDRAPEFAQPILTRIRAAVHRGCPDVEETIKWGMPSFTYHGLLCGMAAFKRHATLGFWKSSLVLTTSGGRADQSMGQFGRIESLADLPPANTLVGYVRQAARLNRERVKVPRPRRAPRPAPRAPADLQAALKKDRKALAAWQDFPPSHQREYVEWISDAKTAATRSKRLATAIEWIGAGKSRNWKYVQRAGKE